MSEYWDRFDGGSPPPLFDVLAEFDRLLEVGIGQRTAVAAALSEAGVGVTAVDVADRDVPDGVAFVQDDVTDPDRSVYADADAIYALRLPLDIQEPVAGIADRIDVPLFFTTLGTDPAVVPTEKLPIEQGTLHVYTPGKAPGRAR